MQKIMIKTDKVKDKEQRIALNSWAKAGFTGSIIAGTGFGKSRCGILAVNHILKHKENAKAIVLVPTIQLQDQFIEEFHKWGKINYLDRVEILCYQSAYKLQNQHYDIVVCDEIHLGLSPEYRKFFDNNTYDSLLCMTATLPEEPEYRKILSDLAPSIYTISLDKCVNLGLVAPYKIYCISVKLTDEERVDYKQINNHFIYYKYKLGQFDAFNMAKYHISNKSSSGEDRANAAQFYRCIRARKDIIDNAENKIKKFKELVANNLKNKILAFGGVNKFTDKLAKSVNANAYHSGKTTKQRKEILKDFKEGTSNILCSTKALNQGLDVSDANMGIICGLTSKSLSMIQRIGRLIRFEKGKTGIIYVLYVENSQEEKWLKNSVRTLGNVRWI